MPRSSQAQWLNDQLRTTVAPLLRGHGLRGSGRIWRGASDQGDHLIVEVVSSRFRPATAPEVWLETGWAPRAWLRERGISSPPRIADALASRRWGPTTPGADGRWHYDSPETAASVATAMAARLDGALPQLLRLRDPNALVQALREQDEGTTTITAWRSADQIVGLLRDGSLPRTERTPAGPVDRAEVIERALAQFPFLRPGTDSDPGLLTAVIGTDPVIRIGYEGGVDGARLLEVQRFLVGCGLARVMVDDDCPPADRDLAIHQPER